MTFLQALQAKVVGRSGTYLIRADVNHLPLRPEPVFDRIISTQVFEHLPSKQLRQHFLASSRTLLREEGRFVLTTYNFSRAKRKAGVPKEGFHPGSGIYYYCYDATELRKELAPYFHVAELHGIRNNFPRRVTEQLGKMGVLVDRLIERTRLSLTLGHLLLACCYPLSYNT
jgi:cyclopropane fatty-acyl-phospholipid synthase-like methyltransferase